MRISDRSYAGVRPFFLVGNSQPLAERWRTSPRISRRFPPSPVPHLHPNVVSSHGGRALTNVGTQGRWGRAPRGRLGPHPRPCVGGTMTDRLEGAPRKIPPPSLCLPPPAAAEGRARGGGAASSLSIVAPPTRGRWRPAGSRPCGCCGRGEGSIKSSSVRWRGSVSVARRLGGRRCRRTFPRAGRFCGTRRNQDAARTNGCTRGGVRVRDDGWVTSAARVIRNVRASGRTRTQAAAGTRTRMGDR